MVTTKRISAALMSRAVFDQGVVGVFPHRTIEVSALLLYLNSASASEKMKKILNGSANNSPNYLNSLPIPPFSERDIQLAAHLLAASSISESLPPDACHTVACVAISVYQDT